MSRMERAIKNAYYEVLAKGQGMGKQVRIGSVVQTIKENYPKEFTNEGINSELIRLFYIENKIDLSPGNTNYYIDDKNGNKFGYMLWKNGSETEEKEEKKQEKGKFKNVIRCHKCNCPMHQVHTYDDYYGIPSIYAHCPNCEKDYTYHLVLTETNNRGVKNPSPGLYPPEEDHT